MDVRRALIVCSVCRSPLAENADFCEECGGALRPGWFCWSCEEFNQPDQDSKCSFCGRPADTESGQRLKRRQYLAAAALFAFVSMVIGILSVRDLRLERHALSTKDGRFQQQVQRWLKGEAPAP